MSREQALSYLTNIRRDKITGEELRTSVGIIYDDIPILPTPPSAPSTISVTTASLANFATENGTVALGLQYKVCKVVTNRPARVRLYYTTDDRNADISRTPGDIPADTVGVFLDLVTYAGALSFPLTPVIQGFLDSGTAVPYAIQNLSGETSAVTVTFSYFS